ncbi:MAG: hypothetical protein HKP61_07140 [Dactylosporangium sp.]|nr:hypothetical protein [Dactylosporangium sp.]NNJ60718.1 hypothetical protein [Dactylosporangium sp.]
MKLMIRWYRWIAALVGGAVAGALVPAVAWAHTDPAVVAVGEELAKRKARSGVAAVGFGGALCCLLVVALIVLVVVMIARRRK